MVTNGQLANQTNFNNAFMSRTVNTSTIGVVALENVTDVNSGAFIVNVQRALNEIFDTTGMTGEGDASRKVYASNNKVANGDSRKVAIGKLDTAFDATSGHDHDGIDSKKVSATSLLDINQYIADLQTTTFDSAGGTSDDITASMSGKISGGNATTAGVITDAPSNRCEIRTKTTGLQIEDAQGQKVYGRVTFSGATWTLTYYTNESGSETSHSLSTQDIRIYFKEVFTLATRPTIPADIGEVGTLDLTADVIDATTTLKGKVLLGSTTPSDVTSTASAGTANTEVANADHAHEGLHSISKSGSAQIVGDATLSASGGITLTQTAQDIQIHSPPLTSNAPEDVASAASVGTALDVSRSDHKHRGVHILKKQGDTDIYGDITLTGVGGTTATQSGQNIEFSSPALSSTTPEDVASAGDVGDGTTTARANHKHRGVLSLAKSGSSALYGAVTLSEGTNVSLIQVGQNIQISATASAATGAVSTDGGAFHWVEGPGYAPNPAFENNVEAYQFDAGVEQILYTFFKVPFGYTSGNRIRFRGLFYSADTSGNTVVWSGTATLVRRDTDDITAPTLTQASSHSITTGAGSGNKPTEIQLDISDSAGQIGGTNVAARDLILFQIRRNISSTSTQVAKLLPWSSEVTFV